MHTETDHTLDTRTKQQAQQGVNAKRRARLMGVRAPLHVLDAKGVWTPRTFDYENLRTYPTTVWLDEAGIVYAEDREETDATPVHLHQKVRETDDRDFGSFGNVETDTPVEWTVVDLTDGTVTLTVVGDWAKKRDVQYSDFMGNYEPIYLNDGEPRWGY